MEIRKATGLVLHSRQSGEADVLARILTGEFGKTNFVFKGLKKSKKRPLAAGEPGTILQLMYHRHDNRDFQVVNEFRVVRHRLDLRSDLGCILHLYFILEVVDKTTGHDDPQSRVYSLATAAIDALAESVHHVHLSAFFLIHLLRFHGVLPDLNRCRMCGTTNLRSFTLDTTDFMPVCDRCLTSRTGGRTALDVTAREFVTAALGVRFSSLECERFAAGAISSLLFHLALFVESYFRCEIKSKGMLFSGL
ncbi:MAG TPA: DNA repair protein RecO [Spirochaetota bacterium]|nr:DNA repair protein RecO [Spirochaetota bacterium]